MNTNSHPQSTSLCPLLSVCMLCKNEAWNLNRVFTEFRSLLHTNLVEFVVADTGSTDPTLQVLRGWQREHFTIHVHELPWDDHFANARNALHAKASGEWIFWLDPDMRLAPAHDPWSTFLRLLNDLGNMQSAIDGLVVTVRDESNPDRPKRFSSARLIRKGVPLEGRVHENPKLACARAYPLTLVHSRVENDEEKAAKRIRYERLLHQEMAENKGNLMAHKYLLDMYLRENRWLNVEKILQRLEYWDHYDMTLSGMERLTMGRKDSAFVRFRSAAALCPVDVRALTFLGDLLLDSGDLDGAETHFRQACELDWETLRNHGVGFYSEEEIVVLPRMSYSVLLAEKGEIASAKKLLNDALSMCPSTIQKERIERNLNRLQSAKLQKSLLVH